MVKNMVKKLLKQFQHKRNRKQGQTAVKTLRRGIFWQQDQIGSASGRERVWLKV